MSPGTAPKSLSRSLVEVGAIVVSILLAFAIDAAWDVRQQRSEEQEVLAGLQQDFLANQSQMTRVIGTHRARATSYAWFRSATPQTVRLLSPDSATSVYRLLYAPHTFDAVRGNVNALIGAGKLGLVQNRRLRERLVTFLNLTQDLVEEGAIISSGAQAVLEATIPHGGPWNSGPGTFAEASALPAITPSELASIRQDTQLMGLIGMSHQWSIVYLGELDTMSGIIDEILDLIEQDLKD